MFDFNEWVKQRDSIQLRPAQRKAFCRGCDATIKEGDNMVSTYSSRNRGQHIHFCLKCAEFIGNLVKEGV